MRLLLIRHAQSANNLLYAQTGGMVGRSHDPALTPLGHQQAQALAEFARHDATFQAVMHLYSSLTTRAVQTAAPLAEVLGLKVQGLPHAYETGGLFLRDEAGMAYSVTGKTHAELLAENPHLLWPADLPQQEAWAGGFEPEDDEEGFLARAGQVLADLKALHSGDGEGDELVALVTHGNFTQYLLRSLVAHGVAYFRMTNTATTLISLPPPQSLAGWGPVVEWVNRFDHLQVGQMSQ